MVNMLTLGHHSKKQSHLSDQGQRVRLGTAAFMGTISAEKAINTTLQGDH